MLEETQVTSEIPPIRAFSEDLAPHAKVLGRGHPDDLQLKSVKCFHPSPYKFGILMPRRPIREWVYSRRRPIGMNNAKLVSEKSILQYMPWHQSDIF